MKDADDVCSGEDGTEFEGDLLGIGARWQFTSLEGRAGFAAQQGAPLLLDAGDFVVDASGATTNLGGGDEEAATGEDAPLHVPAIQAVGSEAFCGALSEVLSPLYVVYVDGLGLRITSEFGWVTARPMQSEPAQRQAGATAGKNSFSFLESSAETNGMGPLGALTTQGRRPGWKPVRQADLPRNIVAHQGTVSIDVT